ncbi:hypothetical protein [Nocardia concava]|uniref:hypothetical protein n=1 Tax=Nocardia concava TaxID=257281 RepID=UPI0002FE57D1|nr:hypothetical protein [Nocardia concava]
MRTVAALPIAFAAALLAGCGSSGDASAPPSATTTAVPAAATTTAAAGPSKTTSPRGNLVEPIGTEAGIRKPGEDPVIKWTVTEIKADVPCTESTALPSENGHFVVVSIDAETSAGFVPAKLPAGFFHPGNYWSLVDASGITHPHADSTAVYRCRKGDWPIDLAPGSKYRFQLTFDSPTASGILAFAPTGPGGWEWNF